MMNRKYIKKQMEESRNKIAKLKDSILIIEQYMIGLRGYCDCKDENGDSTICKVDRGSYTEMECSICGGVDPLTIKVK